MCCFMEPDYENVLIYEYVCATLICKSVMINPNYFTYNKLVLIGYIDVISIVCF